MCVGMREREVYVCGGKEGEFERVVEEEKNRNISPNDTLLRGGGEIESVDMTDEEKKDRNISK